MFKLARINIYAVVLTFILSYFSIQILRCEEAQAFESQQQYENQVSTGKGYTYIATTSLCTDPYKVLMPWTIINYWMVNMPTNVDHWSDGKFVQPADHFLAQYAAERAFTMLALTAGNVPIGYEAAKWTFPLLGTYALFASHFFTACTNTYIMQPHEYVNYTNGWTRKGTVNGVIKNVHPCAVTRDEVPFFFQCSNEDGYGYSAELCSDSPILDISTTCAANGSNQCICNGMVSKPPNHKLALEGKVGKIVIGYDGTWLDRISNSRTAFRPKYTYTLNPNDISKRSISAIKNPDYNSFQFIMMFPYTFLSLSPFTGVQACLTLNTVMPPVLVGCGPLTPPKETIRPDPLLLAFVGGTRCSYIYGPRNDLNALAGILNPTDDNGHSGASVRKFLSSPLHITSTVVGCAKDLIYKVVSQSGTNSSLSSIQSNMRNIVFSVLTLYVALVGIKIMSSPDLRRGEYIMFLMKFVLVVYFTTPSAWYPTSTNPNSLGILNALIYGSDEIGSYFTEAINVNDPVGMCRYQYNGANVLGERVINVGGTSTPGFKGVRVTMWDLLDCKLLNYLNLGTCNYTLGGVVVAWIFSICLSFSFMAMLFAIMMLIYAIIIIDMVFKLAQIFILSAIVIGVLVSISPICIVLSLFPFTKGIFDEWLRKLFGYMLFPALMTALLCMSIAAIDAVYYGKLNIVSNSFNLNFSRPVNQLGADESAVIRSLCSGINNSSLFCKTFSYTGDPCGSTKGDLASMFSKDKKYILGFKMRVIDNNIVNDYLAVVLPVMLIAWFFYMFTGSGMEIVSNLTGITGMDKMAKGALALTEAIGAIGSAAKDGAKGARDIGSKGSEMLKGAQNLMKKR